MVRVSVRDDVWLEGIVAVDGENEWRSKVEFEWEKPLIGIVETTVVFPSSRLLRCIALETQHFPHPDSFFGLDQMRHTETFEDQGESTLQVKQENQLRGA